MGGRTHGKNTNDVLAEIRPFHPDLIYDRFEYKNANTKVILGCQQHGYFEKWPNDMKYGKGGCPKCNNSWKKTHNEFVQSLPAHIECTGRYKNAKTKLDFICRIHDYQFTTTPNQICSGHINCPECVHEKSTLTKLLVSKSIVDPAIKSEYMTYRQTVWRYSNRSYKQYMSHKKRDRQNHLDHVLSIVDGYRLDIPAHIVGSIYNLQVIPAYDNRRKSYKSNITPEELLERYYNGI